MDNNCYGIRIEQIDHKILGYDRLFVSEINNVFVRVQADYSILKELHEHFAFYPENYKFHPSYKNRLWDGKIRLFHFNEQKLYRGLLPDLKQFAREKGYEYRPDGNLNNNVKLEIDDVAKFINSLSLPFVPYEHQIQALVEFVRRQRMVLVSATGSGKSLVIYLAARWFDDRKILIVVTRAGLATQLFKDFEKYSEHSNLGPVEDYVHVAGMNDELQTDKRITIATWQKVYRQKAQYFKQFNMVIGDEAHHYNAKSLKQIMEYLINCDVRLAMTGTLQDSKVDELSIKGLFGDIYQPATNVDLMDRGVILKPQINVIVLNYDKDSCKIMRRAKDFKKERDYVIQHKKRNTFISKLAAKAVKNGNTLVLYRYVEKQGIPLFEEIKQTTKHPVFFISRATTASEREKIRTFLNEHSGCILVASTGTFSEGADVPSLSNAILASPVKSKITTLQSIGRILRTSDGKSKATIYDIVDNLSIGKYISYGMKHGAVRMKMYIDNAYKYATTMVDI